MITVDRLVLREIALSLHEPFRTLGAHPHRRILLVEAVAADGEIGWGECVAEEAPAYSAETVDTAWLALPPGWRPRCSGGRSPGPEEMRADPGAGLPRSSHGQGGGGDGRLGPGRPAGGVALARLLGGGRERVETGISLGIQGSPERPGGTGRRRWRRATAG